MVLNAMGKFVQPAGPYIIPFHESNPNPIHPCSLVMAFNPNAGHSETTEDNYCAGNAIISNDTSVRRVIRIA